MRKGLDLLYAASGLAAAGFIVLICLVVSAQVMLNLITRILGTEYSYTIPSYADFAGYFLAAASFLALAYTLTRGGHIRVTLVLQGMGERLRLAAELFSLALSGALSAFATWYTIGLNRESYAYGDLSFGMIAIPIWIPQLAVSGGLAILTIAFADLLVQTWRARKPVLRDQGEV